MRSDRDIASLLRAIEVVVSDREEDDHGFVVSAHGTLDGERGGEMSIHVRALS